MKEQETFKKPILFKAFPRLCEVKCFNSIIKILAKAQQPPKNVDSTESFHYTI